MTVWDDDVPVVDFADLSSTWTRRPCVVGGLGELGSVDVYGLCSRIGAAVRAGAHRRPDDVKLFTAPPVPTELASYLPEPAEKDFSTYAARVSRELGKDWSFVLNSAQAVSLELYRHARDVLVQLRETEAGLPAGVSDCFIVAGSYSTGPTQIHKDTADVFLFVAEGVKTMLLWPYDVLSGHAAQDADPLHNYVALKIDPSAVNARPLRLTGGPGDVLYWPSSYWHCAESNGRPSLSLHLAAHRYRDMAPVWAGAFARAGVGAGTLWESTERAIGGTGLTFGKNAANAATSAVQQWSLTRHSTANFEILPDLDSRVPPERGVHRVVAAQRSPISWAVDAGRATDVIVAANGRSFRLPARDETISLLTALASLKAGAVLDLGPWSAPSGPVGDTAALLDAVHAAVVVDVA